MLTDPIGSGSYGTVWRAINVQLHGEPDQDLKLDDSLSNKYVAIKVVSKVEHMSIESRTRLAREASIMKSLDHPLMADLFYFMEDESNSYLVMEYLENSSLLDLINSTLEEWEYEEDEDEVEANNKIEPSNRNDIERNKIKVTEKTLPDINSNISSTNNAETTNESQKDTNRTKKFSKINTLDENTVRKIFVQLIVALEFLHNVQHVAHRDIKAENVLLDRYNNIRIIDFGLSAIVQDENSSMKRTVGSVAYTAPEILMKKRYTKSADIWSAGVLLYALSTSRLPFISQPNSKITTNSKNKSNAKSNSYLRSDSGILSRSQNPSSFYDTYNDPKKMCQMILHGDLYIPETVSPDLQDLLRRMLEKDPNKRITIKEIEEHPFFSQVQYKMLIDFVKRQDKIEDIDLKLDPEIVAEMESRGMNCELLSQSLFVQELDEVSAAYKEMKKVKVMKDLSELYKELEKSSNQTLNDNKILNQEKNIDIQQISDQIEPQICFDNPILQPEKDNKDSLPNSSESSCQDPNSFFYCGNALHKIVHDDFYDDSSESNTDHEFNDTNNEGQHKFRKSQSVVISELNLNVLLNSNESSVQTSPPLFINNKKNKPLVIPHPSTPQQQLQQRQQYTINSQMVRSQTSTLIFNPNDFSDGSNARIVPKSYVRPRIHLGMMKV